MPGRPTGAEVGAAARVGDPIALAAVEDLAGWLARGLALAVDVFDPEVIVIGGGVSTLADLYLPTALSQLPQLMTGGGHRPLARVVPAELHDTASMVGAGLLALD